MVRRNNKNEVKEAFIHTADKSDPFYFLVFGGVVAKVW